MQDATTAKVAVLCGKAVGSVYNALAPADITIAVEGAVIGPVEPLPRLAYWEKRGD